MTGTSQLRALRGATTASANSAEAISEAVAELLDALVAREPCFQPQGRHPRSPSRLRGLPRMAIHHRLAGSHLWQVYAPPPPRLWLEPWV